MRCHVWRWPNNWFKRRVPPPGDRVERSRPLPDGAQRGRSGTLPGFRAQDHQPKVTAEEYQVRLDRLTEIFRDIVVHADAQSVTRCPYKNRRDECTAKFGCRNQRKPAVAGGLRLCGGDDKIDYRGAWEVDPEGVQRMSEQLAAGHRRETEPAPAPPTLFDQADDLALRVPSSCGRSGLCHECGGEVRSEERRVGAGG